MDASEGTDSLGREDMTAKLTALPSPGRGYLSDAQIDVLLRPIRGSRVSRDGKGYSHVEAYDIRAHLTRCFGFGRWSAEVINQELVFEESSPSGDKLRWTVCYRSLLRLEVMAPDGSPLATFTEGAVGDATNYPSRADAHDMAIKTSQSQALKRAAVNLGDQFGLSLYNGGKTEPLVRHLVTWSPPTEGDAPEDPTAHITTLAPENSATTDTSAREMSPPPPARGASSTVPPPAAEPPAPASQDPADGVNAAPDAVSAMGGQDGPAVGVPGGSPPAAEPSPSSAVSGGPMAEIVGMVNATVLMAPAEASKTLAKAMTLAAKHRLRDVAVPDMTPPTTLGAWLLRLMASAATHQRAQNGAAK